VPSLISFCDIFWTDKLHLLSFSLSSYLDNDSGTTTTTPTPTMFGDQYLQSNHFSAHAVDPFSSPRSFVSSMAQALLATAFFRCWHLLIFFTAWAAAICLIIVNVRDVSIRPTLLTV
jgi:hypothetical protein